MDDIRLSDAIRNLTAQMGINCILDPRVPGSDIGPGRSLPDPEIKGRWKNESAGDVLTTLLKQHKLMMVTNPATTVARIVPANQAVKPVSPSEVGMDSNGVLPTLRISNVRLVDAIKAIASRAHLVVSFDTMFSSSALGRDDGEISIRWENITARQALAAILDNYELVMTEGSANAPARITLKTQDQKKHP